MSLLVKIFYLICAIGINESARILAVYPIPSISHQVVFRPLMQELAKRGHKVTVITPDPAFPKGETPKNLTEIGVHDISYKKWNEFLKTGMAHAKITAFEMKAFLDIFLEVFEAQMMSEDVQKLLNDKTISFDLLFVESCVRPALSLVYRYEVPVIEFSSLGGVHGTFDGTGALTNFFLYPLPLRRRIYDLTLWERISELHNHFMIEQISKEHLKVENKIVKNLFGLKVPSLTDLKKNVQLIFLNVNPIWDSNRPVPPNVIYLGGIHQKNSKPLPEDLKTYLDSSINGVIYISFGTNARPSLLPAEKLRIFTTVFSNLPYDVLWKWDSDELPGQPRNVKISKWLPQSDLLKHPNIKLFITQGGLQSTDEALTAGVAMVVIPFLGDQWYNAEQYVKLNIGISVDLETITENKLRNAIDTILQNRTYRENVARLNRLLRDQPQSPLQRAVWWTEYVLRHGGAQHLRAAGAHVPWAEYYAVDLVLLAVTAATVLCVLIVLVSRLLFLLMRNFKIKVKVN